MNYKVGSAEFMIQPNGVVLNLIDYYQNVQTVFHNSNSFMCYLGFYLRKYAVVNI